MPENIKSKSSNSPFIGRELTGKVAGIINGDKISLAKSLFMQLRLSPAIKGLITAVLMIAVALVIDAKEAADPRLQYLIFIVYGAGIIWTLAEFPAICCLHRKIC
ncbi:MAG: hypothetical protein IPN29_09605 [Saprospiraceae bacterium]|nr:hypothetical protein [Saprospiraceae bacterium]